MRIVLLAIISIFCIQLKAQSELVIDTSKNIVLMKERSYGVLFHTQGWGIKYSQGYNKTAFNRRMITVELGEMQSLRQIRTINPYFTNAKSYVYGKLNSVFTLRGSFGYYKQLNRKPYWGGVELRFFYVGGLTLAITKPIYLYILNASPVIYEYSISEERYDPDEHFVDNIFGRAPFTRGFNNLDVYPGLHAKVGLDFDYASYRNKLKSLEVGATLDVFPRPVPIMAFNDPNYYFLTLYVNFNFGKRYN